MRTVEFPGCCRPGGSQRHARSAFLPLYLVLHTSPPQFILLLVSFTILGPIPPHFVTRSHYVALVVTELTMWTRLSCLCLLSAGIKAMCQDVQLGLLTFSLGGSQAQNQTLCGLPICFLSLSICCQVSHTVASGLDSEIGFC